MYKGRTDVIKKLLEEFVLRYEEQLLGTAEIVGVDDSCVDSHLQLNIQGGDYVHLDVFFERAYLERLTFSEFDEAIIDAIVDVASKFNVNNNEAHEEEYLVIKDIINNLNMIKSPISA